jgi:hypothetical protein
MINQSSSSSSFPITWTGSSVRTRVYHAPRDAVGLAVSSIAPELFFIDAPSALRPDVAYRVIKKRMCVYSKNAMLMCPATVRKIRRTSDKKREGDRWDALPEHDKDICHVVHPAFVYVAQFFVCCGHEQQPCRHQKLSHSFRKRGK